MSALDVVLVTDSHGTLRGANLHEVLHRTYGHRALYVETPWDDDYAGRVVQRGQWQQVDGRQVRQPWDVLDYVVSKEVVAHRTR